MLAHWEMNNNNRELVCCQYCGRDTRARDGICSKCRGIVPVWMGRDEWAGRKKVSRPRDGYDPADYEDDYGDESGPDDVYQESSWHQAEAVE